MLIALNVVGQFIISFSKHVMNGTMTHFNHKGIDLFYLT